MKKIKDVDSELNNIRGMAIEKELTGSIRFKKLKDLYSYHTDNNHFDERDKIADKIYKLEQRVISKINALPEHKLFQITL